MECFVEGVSFFFGEGVEGVHHAFFAVGGEEVAGLEHGDDVAHVFSAAVSGDVDVGEDAASLAFEGVFEFCPAFFVDGGGDDVGGEDDVVVVVELPVEGAVCHFAEHAFWFSLVSGDDEEVFVFAFFLDAFEGAPDLVGVFENFCFFGEVGDVGVFGGEAVLGDASAHEDDFAFEFFAEVSEGFKACDVAGECGDDEAFAGGVRVEEDFFKHLFGDAFAGCFAGVAGVDAVLDEGEDAFFAELFEAFVVWRFADGGVVVELVIIAVNDDAVGSV